MERSRRRWTLAVLCLGALMVVIDGTIVNVALPSIRVDLAFSDANLAWVASAYMITFGGFLLVSGRAADLFGQRRTFLAGIALFTLASAACGLAVSQTQLIAARAVQGFAGAIVSAVTLAMLVSSFTQQRERARAIGVYGFISSSGGILGLLLGGPLTSAFGWHWIFLINIPIGVVVYLLSSVFLPRDGQRRARARADIAGALTVTSAFGLMVYTTVRTTLAGWAIETFQALGITALLLVAFLLIEARVDTPLLPLRLFRFRAVIVANVVGILWAAAAYAWLFIAALYLQFILEYGPTQVAFAFLPATITTALVSLSVSHHGVVRFGLRRVLVAGLILFAGGLAAFSCAPVDGNVMVYLLPAMILIGTGSGLATPPLLLAATGEVGAADTGIASGIVNTTVILAGAVGTALLAGVAAACANSLMASGTAASLALNSGYQLAFRMAAVMAAAAAVIAFWGLRTPWAVRNADSATASRLSAAGDS
jgi:EmrB/QacA subfamily drug resistance transporter